MKANRLLKDAKRTLVDANERFGWQGDEADQAWDVLAHVLGHAVVTPDVAPVRHTDAYVRVFAPERIDEHSLYLFDRKHALNGKGRALDDLRRNFSARHIDLISGPAPQINPPVD